MKNYFVGLAFGLFQGYVIFGHHTDVSHVIKATLLALGALIVIDLLAAFFAYDREPQSITWDNWDHPSRTLVIYHTDGTRCAVAADPDGRVWPVRRNRHLLYPGAGR